MCHCQGIEMSNDLKKKRVQEVNLASCQRLRRRIQSVSDHGICTESARAAHFSDERLSLVATNVCIASPDGAVEMEGHRAPAAHARKKTRGAPPRKGAPRVLGGARL
jgi:hypothetical protein